MLFKVIPGFRGGVHLTPIFIIGLLQRSQRSRQCRNGQFRERHDVGLSAETTLRAAVQRNRDGINATGFLSLRVSHYCKLRGAAHRLQGSHGDGFRARHTLRCTPDMNSRRRSADYCCCALTRRARPGAHVIIHRRLRDPHPNILIEYLNEKNQSDTARNARPVVSGSRCIPALFRIRCGLCRGTSHGPCSWIRNGCTCGAIRQPRFRRAPARRSGAVPP